MASFSYAQTDEEAKRRASDHRIVDGCPNIPLGLLSSEHICEYVAKTGMIHPFHENEHRLKPASYEMAIGRLIFWDDEKNLQVKEFVDGGKNQVRLEANSITFAQVRGKFRLPFYIACRFNLRIQHVHRGLLLGTGPLVDPSFQGDLLIPIHNLTADPYEFNSDDGLIWVEFTKTTYGKTSDIIPPRSGFFPLDEEKIERPYYYYLNRANKGNAIRSSIPEAISGSAKNAKDSAKSAKSAQRYVQLITGFGILAIAVAIGGMYSLFGQVIELIQNAPAEDTVRITSESLSRMQDELEALRSAVAELQEALLRAQEREPAVTDGFMDPEADVGPQLGNPAETE